MQSGMVKNQSNQQLLLYCEENQQANKRARTVSFLDSNRSSSLGGSFCWFNAAAERGQQSSERGEHAGFLRELPAIFRVAKLILVTSKNLQLSL